MANLAFRGYLGSQTNQPLIDFETLARQRSPAACVMTECNHAGNTIRFDQSIPVGKTKRDPGFNFDGTIADDMKSGDEPAVSASLKNDPIFKETDDQLAERLRSLLSWLSVGEMKTVADDMLRRFRSGSGKSYENEILNREVQKNPAFRQYHNRFINDLDSALKRNHYDPNRIVPAISLNLLNFSHFNDKWQGLGITIHQVWSANAWVTDFSVNCGTLDWNCNIHYALYDHFGLDWADIEKFGNAWGVGNAFKAWFILQHYRSAKPFFTKIHVTEKVNHRFGS